MFLRLPSAYSYFLFRSTASKFDETGLTVQFLLLNIKIYDKTNIFYSTKGRLPTF